MSGRMGWWSGKSAAVLAVFMSLMTPGVYAGPPFVTDDPEPVELGAWEVNYAVTGTQTRGASSTYLPQVDANYGIAPGVQLHMQPQMASVTTSSGKAYGVADTELGVKYRLTPESEGEGDWMVSLYPLLEVPTGNAASQLGAGASSIFLPVWLQSRQGNWTTYGGAGYWVRNAASMQNSWAGGWVLLYQFTERLQFGGELFVRTADTPGGTTSTGFNLGGNYVLSEDYRLLFSAGQGLTEIDPVNQFSMYLALQVLY